jgi:hypothetical protein
VSQSNGTTPWVNVVDAETEDLRVRFDDSSEGFVEFPHGNVRLGESGLLEQLVYYRGWGDWEVNRI